MRRIEELCNQRDRFVWDKPQADHQNTNACEIRRRLCFAHLSQIHRPISNIRFQQFILDIKEVGEKTISSPASVIRLNRHYTSISTTQSVVKINHSLYLVEAVGYGRKFGTQQSLPGGKHFEIILRAILH